MGRWRVLWIAGGLGFLAGLVANLPASVFLRLLGVTAAQAGGVSGSLWQGEARSIDLKGLQLRHAHWRLSPFGLLAGRLSGDAGADFPGGRAAGVFAAGLTGAVGCSDCEVSGSIESLRTILPVRGLAGDFRLRFDRLEWRRGWARRAVGTGSIQNMPLTLAGQGTLNGVTAGYSAVFAADPVPENGLIEAKVTDTAGPLEIDARLKLTPPANYEFAGTMKPRGNAPPAVSNGIQLLGPRQPDGSYSVTFAGSF